MDGATDDSDVGLSIPYSYEYVSDQVRDTWDEQGKQQLLEQASQVIKEADELRISVMMEEIVQSVITGRVPPSSTGDLIKQMVESANTNMETKDSSEVDVLMALLDAISVAYDNNPTLPIERLSDFLLSANIPSEVLRQELDSKLLEKLSLIRQTFDRVGIRKQTNILYRQANFNLMREESEGFAKLVTELFTTSSAEEPSGENVDEALEKVKALIGAFDLDVGRSLDVVLDVFGAVLVKQFRFFVKFLRSSPWWPRTMTETKQQSSTGGLPAWALPGVQEWYLNDDDKATVAEERKARDTKFWSEARTGGLRAFYKLGLATTTNGVDMSSRSDEAKAWIEQTGTNPPSGNRDAAQLLGFKLRFYSSSPARDENDVLPDNLIYLSALLIKIGFISLHDLYPHIWRPDESMDELRKLKEQERDEKERAAKGGGVRNALAMAGALADDTAPAVPSRLRESTTRATTPLREADVDKASTKEPSSDPADQKVLLLKSLLAVGALPEALFILGQFPWIIELYPEVSEYIHRILHESLNDVARQAQPLLGRYTLGDQKPLYEADLPGLAKGQVRMDDQPERKTLRWALLDRNDSSDGTQYRFYWDEWNDNIPICQNADDVLTLCDTLLPLVGVKIGQDPSLVVKLARVGKASLQTDNSEANRSRWLDLLKRTILPSVSLTRSNAGVVNEVFELMCYYSVNTRYLLYMEWTYGKVSRNPDVRAATNQARIETGHVLKRISKTNIRDMARKLAGVAYANPHIVITSALAQIESYDSIANVFVEGVRYFTDLGYDVLTWGLITALSKQGRDRMQESGMFASRWLGALSSFSGKVYKRYSMMKPGPILQHVTQQLVHGNHADLKMLEYLTTSMAGIAKDTTYNDAQLQAMGGGALLQSSTLSQLLDQREKSKSTAKRLIKALLESGLTGKLVLSMAQQRQACVFEDGDIPLKAVANTYDEIQGIMEQYLELLRSSLGIDDFALSIPNVIDLVTAYELRPELAFWIARPVIAHQIADFNREQAALRKVEETVVEVNGDVEMSEQAHADSEEDGEATENENVIAAAATPSDADALNAPLEDADDMTPVPDEEVNDKWHPVLRNIMDGLEQNVPEEVLSSVGLGFYVTFWQLSLYDITVPSSSYTDEMGRQKKEKIRLAGDKSDVSLTGVRDRQKKTKAIEQLVDDLVAENRQHLKHHQESKGRMQREKDVWFVGKARQLMELNAALLEYCFLPRILLSPLDAYFCFKFAKYLHSSGTPNFRTIGMYDLLLRGPRLTSLIFMCSSKEADNLGRFLNELLKDLARWHASQTVYEREAWGPKKTLPGFSTKVEAGKPVVLLEFESFRRIVYKWHTQIYQALLKCLTSPEYMHVRNAISVLRTVAGVYPQVDWHGTQVQKAVDKLGQSDKADLKVSSRALLGALSKRAKTWLAPQQFRLGQDKPGEGPPAPDPKEATKAIKVLEAPKPANESSNNSSKTSTVKEQIAGQANQQDVVKDEKTAPPPDKPSSERSVLPARPNGSSTPRAGIDNPRERPGSRLEASKPPPSLPRKLSPPPRHQPPVNLPSRPDSMDHRNGNRESRMPPRPAVDAIRAAHPREPRSDYRGSESYEEYERHQRRHERPDPPPHSTSRDERVYGRERDSDRHHDRSRPSERDRPTERERLPPGPTRERDSRDRPSRGPSRQGQPDESPRGNTSAPARPASAQPEPMSVNPARAALINNGAPPSAPSMSIRGQAQERNRTSRAPSPHRDADRPPTRRPERDDRPPSDRSSSIRGPINDSPSAAAPRPSYGVPPPRDSRPSHASVDMQKGRLEQDPTHRPPPRSDRPQLEAEVPSGPRAHGMPAPRARPNPTVNTQAAQIPPVERSTPTGPARHSRQNSYQDHSAPQTPDTTGVHPSRLNLVGSPTENQRQPPPAPQHSPPAGPRSGPPANAPSGPSPTTRAPPSGPQNNETNGRGQSNRHLNAVNNTLSQASRGTSVRGRGGSRQNSTTFNTHTPSAPSNQGPRDGFAPQQQDLFGGQNPNGMPVGPRPASARQDNMRGRPEDDSERRSTRRQDEPREHRNEREKDDRERRDDRPRREEHEDRRGYRAGPPRDEQASRKHAREGEGPPYPGAGGRGAARTASESKRPRRGP